MGFLGAKPGPWHSDLPHREYLYNFFKYVHGRGDISADRGIRIDTGAAHTLVEHNHIDGGLVGLQIYDTHDLIFRHNRVNDFSSVGLSLRQDSRDIHVYDNVVYNCNLNIRLHNLNLGQGHRIYIYRNRLLQQPHMGWQFFCHAVGGSDYPDHTKAEIFIYHNTIVGGRVLFRFPRPDVLTTGAPGFVMLNNLIADTNVLFSWRYDPSDPNMMGLFDYNWISEPTRIGWREDQTPAWLGKHNILGDAANPWADRDIATVQAFDLPSSHSARGAGVDLSRPFTLEGQTYSALPGLEQAERGRPVDIGAVQHADD